MLTLRPCRPHCDRPWSPGRPWCRCWPIVALIGTWGRDPGPVLVVVVAVILGAAVLAAVHHAEVVAHRVGEPYGSLVLAVAVTVIEVALIVTLMVVRRPGHRDAGPGHRLRRGDDHHERHRRAVAAGRGDPAPAGAVQRRGHRRGAGHRHLAGHAQPGVAHLHRERARPGVLPGPAGLRRDRLAGAVRHVRAHPDRAAPRLLPAGDLGRARSSRRTASTPNRRATGPR